MAKVDLTGCEAVTSLVTWVDKEERSGGCADCAISVIVPWYKDILKQTGHHDLSREVEKLASVEGLNATRVATMLDSIKAKIVNSELRDTLILYDCMLQTYKEGSNG